MSNEKTDITGLLHRWRDGDDHAGNRLFEAVQPEMRQIARKHMAREARGHLFQPTELISEAYTALVRSRKSEVGNRQHFFAIIARIMRHRLIDFARAGGNRTKVDLSDLRESHVAVQETDQLFALERELQKLQSEHPHRCAVVRLKYFHGATDGEIAEQLNISVRSVQRHWRDARLELFQRLFGDARSDSGNPTNGHS